MNTVQKTSLAILVLGYIAAGINHFIHPDGYIDIIPTYLPQPEILNYIAGVCEIVFGAMLIFRPTRTWGALLLIVMLAAFLPVHVAMVQHAPLQVGRFYVTPFIAWLRLLLQPVLMLWLAWHMQTKHRTAA